MFKLSSAVHKFKLSRGFRFFCQRNLIGRFLFMEKGSGCNISKSSAFRLIKIYALKETVRIKFDFEARKKQASDPEGPNHLEKCYGTF